MDTPFNDNQDLNDSCVLPNVTPKKAFLEIKTLKNYLLQHEKNIPNMVCTLQKIKDNIKFSSQTKKKQITLNAYFRIE